MGIIPENFDQWKDCIVNRFVIPSTRNLIEGRLLIYEDGSNPETIRFEKLYGIQHLRNISRKSVV